MTQKLAESVKDLAKPMVEALKKISYEEGVCNICNGTGQDVDYKSQCRKCKGTGVEMLYQNGWKWEPEPGEWCLWGETALLITDVDDYILSVSGVEIESVNMNQVTPILGWEEIERVLEGVGYELIVAAKKCGNNERCVTIDRLEPLSDGRIKHTPMISVYYGKFRQEAVMKAVIALGKKLGEEIKHV